MGPNVKWPTLSSQRLVGPEKGVNGTQPGKVLVISSLRSLGSVAELVDAFDSKSQPNSMQFGTRGGEIPLFYWYS
jgi:hypothetical protein